MEINLYDFILYEKQCIKYKGCKFNDLGFCECMDEMHLNDIIVKSSELLELKYPNEIMYTCTMAKPKTGLYLNGDEINNWKMDGFEHEFGKEEYKICDCEE